MNCTNPAPIGGDSVLNMNRRRTPLASGRTHLGRGATSGTTRRPVRGVGHLDAVASPRAGPSAVRGTPRRAPPEKSRRVPTRACGSILYEARQGHPRWLIQRTVRRGTVHAGGGGRVATAAPPPAAGDAGRLRCSGARPRHPPPVVSREGWQRIGARWGCGGGEHPAAVVPISLSPLRAPPPTPRPMTSRGWRTRAAVRSGCPQRRRSQSRKADGAARAGAGGGEDSPAAGGPQHRAVERCACAPHLRVRRERVAAACVRWRCSRAGI